MIKIFGKLRYHWQPELSITITYWCLSIAPIFISLALLYENTKISRSSFILFIIFIVLVWIDFNAILKFRKIKIYYCHVV